VPISKFGGVAFAETISEMKLAVMPVIASNDAACIALVTLKVAPNAP